MLPGHVSFQFNFKYNPSHHLSSGVQGSSLLLLRFRFVYFSGYDVEAYPLYTRIASSDRSDDTTTEENLSTSTTPLSVETAKVGSVYNVQEDMIVSGYL